MKIDPLHRSRSRRRFPLPAAEWQVHISDEISEGRLGRDLRSLIHLSHCPLQPRLRFCFGHNRILAQIATQPTPVYVAPHPNPGPTRRSLSLLQTTFLMPSSHLTVLLRSDGPDFWQCRKHTTLSTLDLCHPHIEHAAPDELAAPEAQVRQVGDTRHLAVQYLREMGL